MHVIHLDENLEAVLQIQAPKIHAHAFHAPVLSACFLGLIARALGLGTLAAPTVRARCLDALASLDVLDLAVFVLAAPVLAVLDLAALVLAVLDLALEHIHPVALQVVVILGAKLEHELGMLRLQLHKLPLRRLQERLVAVAGLLQPGNEALLELYAALQLLDGPEMVEQLVLLVRTTLGPRTCAALLGRRRLPRESCLNVALLYSEGSFVLPVLLRSPSCGIAERPARIERAAAEPRCAQPHVASLRGHGCRVRSRHRSLATPRVGKNTSIYIYRT